MADKENKSCKCPYCDTEIEETDLGECPFCRLKINHCTTCSYPVPGNMKKCPNCGEEL